MPKYNITEKKEKTARYRTPVNPAVADQMKDQILEIIIMQKKYKDKDYSARHLANDIGTNTRYISAVIATKFHCNYTTFINQYRIEEAMAMLTDKRYKNLNMQEISDLVGFSNRQSFYASFYRFNNMTPRKYRMNYKA